jgi:hypothetical protein
MLDARRCHYHAGKSASRGTRVAAQARHARRGARDTRKYTRPAEYSTYRCAGYEVSGYLTPVITSRRLRTTTTATYIFIGCEFRIICFLHLPPSATCARPPPLGREPSTARSHQTQPTSGAQIGVSSREPRTGGHHAGARRRRTAASSGRPAARHEATKQLTKPPPRAHLANELGSLQRVPCFSSSLPRRLSADGGATRPFRRPRHTPKRASARLGSCRRWHCTGRWHCSPLALH